MNRAPISLVQVSSQLAEGVAQPCSSRAEVLAVLREHFPGPNLD